MVSFAEKKRFVRESGLTEKELRQIINEIEIDQQVEEDEALRAEAEADMTEEKALAYLAKCECENEA